MPTAIRVNADGFNKLALDYAFEHEDAALKKVRACHTLPRLCRACNHCLRCHDNRNAKSNLRKPVLDNTAIIIWIHATIACQLERVDAST